MWKRFAEQLHCIECGALLHLQPIEERRVSVSDHHLAQADRLGIPQSHLVEAVDAGILLCRECQIWFPIFHGLPILLPYSVEVHREFRESYADIVDRLDPSYGVPSSPPAPGEGYVRTSFSNEWLDYDYDGVLWSSTYEDREKLFLAEVGSERPQEPCRFLEIGCGLGLATASAANNFPGDAVGVDLSLASMRAAKNYADHPFVHFVNASLWKLPFRPNSFDILYSHGVLHHTYSTEKAFASLVPLCKQGGRAYIWVYGTKGIHETPSRMIAFAIEMIVRPLLARLPSPLATILISPFALLYMGISRIHRRSGRVREPYTYTRALHAARDRLTPLYAHRTDRSTVERWFKQFGFADLHFLREDEVPPSTADMIRRSIGMRGWKRGTSIGHRPAGETLS